MGKWVRIISYWYLVAIQIGYFPPAGVFLNQYSSRVFFLNIWFIRILRGCFG